MDLERLERLERWLVTKDKTQEMSASDLKELSIQYGWFAEDTKEFEDLSQCPYDKIEVSVYDRSLRLFSTRKEWKYFLPVKNLQLYLTELSSVIKIQNMQINAFIAGRL